MAYLFCVIAIVADTCYSFVQHYSEPMDGDMGESVLPLDYIEPLYNDPFGIKMLADGDMHAAPNRYFSHRSMCVIYRTVPFALQSVVDPISSLYCTNAICKTVMQMLLVLLLACMACGGFRLGELKFAITCLFFCAMMQACGFVGSIGLVTKSITYSFFYTLPLVFLLFYLLPFVMKEFYGIDFVRNGLLLFLYSALFLLLSCFSGAINPAVSLVAVLTLLIRYFVDFYRRTGSIRNSLGWMPSRYFKFLLPLGVFSLYSLYLGNFNTMWADGISLGQRYALLPKGIVNMFVAGNGGFGLLFALTLVNYMVVRCRCGDGGKPMLSLFHWILVFSAIYIVFLPFGGYRPYRPLLIRFDTALPISCLFIFYYVRSSVFLLRKTLQSVKVHCFYLGWTVVCIVFFFLYDTPRSYRNVLEIAALKEISQSEDIVVPLTCAPTSVVSWEVPEKPEDSQAAGRLLHLWRVTDKEKLFYFPSRQ